MLVLTRKLQEQIRIGDNIVVTVLRVSGNAVRLGLEAPQEVQILRGELPRFEDSQDESEAGAESAAAGDDEECDPAGAGKPSRSSLADRVEQRVREMAV